jgi:hypothetical protein
MIAIPAARHLADFGADAGLALPQGSGGPAAGDAAAALLDEAFARGVEAGRAAASAELEAAIAEQQALGAKQLAAERQAWAGGTGKKLANSLVAALQDHERRVSEAVARILKPFVAAGLRTQAISELQAGLDALAATDQGAGVHISGPADLLEVMRERLAGKNLAITYTESEECDVRIVAGQATLETRLGEWMAKLDETVR